MIDKKDDIITIANTPVVYNSFRRQDFYIIGGMMHLTSIVGVVASPPLLMALTLRP